MFILSYSRARGPPKRSLPLTRFPLHDLRTEDDVTDLAKTPRVTG